MREIKFRAWDKRDKVVTPVIWIDFNTANEGMKVLTETGKGFAGGGVQYTKNGNLEIMQYTGLKDKNGKEIYEGDIVEIRDTFHKYTVAIKWIDEDAYFGFDVSSPEEYGYLSEWKNMEKIGNIYENPELIK